MKCKNCGHRNPRSARCCEHCQHELNQTPAFTGANMVLLVICAMLTGLLGGVLLSDHLPEEEPETPTLIYSEPAEQTTEPTEATEQESSIPDGTLLIEGSWETGDVKVVAPDDNTLWVQITDDRPDQQYKDLGTAWTVELGFQWESYFIRLGSMAHQELLLSGRNDYWENNLHISQSTYNNGSLERVNEFLQDLDIEKNGDTYTTIIQLPEWFDVSIHDDITSVGVNLVEPDPDEYGGIHNKVFYWETQRLRSNETQILEIADVGLNNYGSAVCWQMKVELLNIFACQMDSVDCSWDDSVINASDKIFVGEIYADYGWEAACSRLTLWHSPNFIGGRNECVSIVLPDDGTIEGPQWITLTGKRDGVVYSRTIHFTLTYNGDYKTGTGWSISDISLE